MALNTFKCNRLTPLHFKGLICCSDFWERISVDLWCLCWVSWWSTESAYNADRLWIVDVNWCLSQPGVVERSHICSLHFHHRQWQLVAIPFVWVPRTSLFNVSSSRRWWSILTDFMPWFVDFSASTVNTATDLTALSQGLWRFWRPSATAEAYRNGVKGGGLSQ